MATKREDSILQWLTLGTFLLMIAVNVLANLLPLNGVTTGEVADTFPNLFAPAGFTFAIWTVIYLLLVLYILYVMGMFRRGGRKVSHTLLRGTEFLFSISCLANTAWIFAWHFYNIPMSMLMMAVIFLCLCLITWFVQNASLTQGEEWWIRLPFSVYYGWITIALVANVTVLLVSLGWDGFGFRATVWTILILLAAALIGAATTVRRQDAAYGLVFLWAYAGILFKHVSSGGFAGAYPAVIAILLVCLVILALALVSLFLPQKHGTRQRRE